jgi:hypothetical protein
MIPAHVRQHRIRQGLIDARGIGPKAKSGHCAGCGLVVLAGWTDGNRAGAWTAIVTPQPLTSLGELWATLAGLTTYAHQVRADSASATIAPAGRMTPICHSSCPAWMTRRLSACPARLPMLPLSPAPTWKQVY